MSETDTMRLAAEIVDKWSGPLKQMQGEMRKLSDVARGVHGQGTKQAQLHEKSYKDLHDSISRVSRGVSSTFGPALATLGITAAGVGGAIAAVVSSVKSLGDQFYTLQDISKRGGVSADWVRALTVAFQDLGIAPDKAQAGIAGLGEVLDQTARRTPAAIANWNQLGGAWSQLGAQLQGLPREQQIGKIFDYFATHKIPPDQARRFYQDILHLPPELATRTSEQINKAIQDGFKWSRDHPYNPINAGKINESLNELRNALQGVKEDFAEAFGVEIIKDAAAAIRAVVDDVKGLVQGLKDVSEWLNKWGSWLGIAGKDTFTKKNYFDPKDPAHRWENNPHWFGGSNTFKDRFPSSDAFKPTDKAEQKESIYAGTLRALREWWSSTGTAKASTGGGGGEGGVGGGGIGGGGDGSLGLPSGRSLMFRRGVHTSPSGYESHKEDLSKLSDLKGNEYLRKMRESRIKEINDDPKLKENVLKMLQLEESSGTGKTAAMEALLNRSVMTGNTIKQELFSGFYGPINRGQLRQSLSNAGRRTSQAAFDAAAKGSDIIHGRTDQGMAGDPNASGPGRVKVPGTTGIFNYWKGRRNGHYFSHEDSKRFADEVESHVNSRAPAPGTFGNRFPSPDAFKPTGPDPWAGGAKPLDLLKAGKQSGLFGDPKGFKSDASLTIDVNAPPGSIKTQLAHKGFENVKFNRGLQMASASQDG